MPSILNRLPIPERDEITFVGTEQVRLKACEIIVWVSLTAHDSLVWDPATPCFPAILDTGHTHNFSIQEEHLVRWARVPLQALQAIGEIRQGGRRLQRYASQIWLHRNVRGKRERLESIPHRLELPRGIVVYPDSSDDFPRLPLLGMRALLASRLHLSVDGISRGESLRTIDWRTRLLNWIS